MTIPAHSRVRAEVSYWLRSVSHNKEDVTESARRLIREISEIFETAQPFRPVAKPQRIAVMSGYGLNAIQQSCDALWMMAIRQRGHYGMGIICDRGLPSCEFNYRGDGTQTPKSLSSAFSPWANSMVCRQCSDTARSILAAANVPFHQLSILGTSDELKAALVLAQNVPSEEIRHFTYKNVRVGDHAFSSTLRCTLRGVVDFEDPEEMWIYRRQLASSILLTDRLNRLIDRERPDKMLGVHGVYVMHGTMVDVCKSRDLPVIIYGIPYRKGTVWFSHKETYHLSLVNEVTRFWDGDDLNAAQKLQVDEYLQSREVGGRDNVNYHPNPILDRARVAEVIGLDPTKPTISMFTNVIWDAQIHYQSNAFDNIFDWIFFTIDYFRKHPHLQLVIRIHPAETKGGFVTRQPLYPEIKSHYPELPGNIFILPPESDISSYTLAEISKACLIFGTKMGVEIAWRGVPVIVAGETFNRGKGFTYDVETKDEYTDLLDGILRLPRNSSAMKDRARRYAYYFFFQKMMDMPLLGPNLARSTRDAHERFYTFSNINALNRGQDRTLDTICDGILDGAPFYLKTNAEV